jgi:hypothetical protein
VKGAVPSLTLKLTSAVKPEVQLILPPLKESELGGFKGATVTVEVLALQPFESVTKTL